MQGMPTTGCFPVPFREILSHPGPEGAVVQCTIIRDSSESKLYPTYKLFLEDPAQLMMAARKRKKSKTSNYILSMDEKVSAASTPAACDRSHRQRVRDRKAACAESPCPYRDGICGHLNELMAWLLLSEE